MFWKNGLLHIYEFCFTICGCFVIIRLVFWNTWNILSFFPRPVINYDELSFHFIECIHFCMKNSGSQVPRYINFMFCTYCLTLYILDTSNELRLLFKCWISLFCDWRCKEILLRCLLKTHLHRIHQILIRQLRPHMWEIHIPEFIDSFLRNIPFSWYYPRFGFKLCVFCVGIWGFYCWWAQSLWTTDPQVSAATFKFVSYALTIYH